ncbi:AraC family transcriptional regulator [Vagococcus elongatus]|uniref:AraC family transcriptional regulator n=1 Tax=Vagococcus elongatus TaxID=180344 RepID=A0A430B197_9ENTE|nr:helix-turn-helix domain-containing protein [Vagococcus elongatus]RSU14021.1 AraC family transcriptional regulator [Vagococcus elongatus]
MSRSRFLEIPKLDARFPFRCFSDLGQGFVYPHWHKEIEIIYVVEGLIKIGVADELVEVKEGEIYYFDSGVPHYFLVSPESRRLVYQFDLSLFSKIFLDAKYGETVQEVFSKRENWSRNWSQEMQNKMQTVLQQLYDQSQLLDEGGLYLFYFYLHQLLFYFYGELPKKSKETKQVVSNESLRSQEVIQKMDVIFSYLETNYQEKITLESVAQEVGFNPQYFSRFFKKNTGITFMAFLTEYRINMAKSILSSEDLPMIEVAEKSGFNSVKTFHHVFKEYVGLSPKKYQKSISGN